MSRLPALSDRLLEIASLLIPGEPMADIGTDHGFLPIYCLRQDIVPFAVLSDVNEGPLAIAERNLSRYGLDPSSFRLALGSGLAVLAPGEAASIVIAGMGGELIASILQASPAVCESARRLILQPRTRSGKLREFLWANGFRIVSEKLAMENGRICQILAAEKGTQTPYAYADIPAAEGVLMSEFLRREVVNITQILDNLSKTAARASEKAYFFEKLAYIESRLRDYA